MTRFEFYPRIILTYILIYFSRPNRSYSVTLYVHIHTPYTYGVVIFVELFVGGEINVLRQNLLRSSYIIRSNVFFFSPLSPLLSILLNSFTRCRLYQDKHSKCIVCTWIFYL